MSHHVADEYVADQRIRDLGASEYLVYLIEKNANSSHLTRVIEFDGPVDPDLMERAFRQMIARRLLLRTRIPPTEGAERPHLVFDESVPAPFTVKQRQGPDHWIKGFNEELNIRIGIDGDPPMRAQLLMSDEPGGELLLSCPHTYCDGRSLVRFCIQLLDEYEALVRGEDGDSSIQPSGISPALEDVLPEWATPERGEELVAAYFERGARSGPPIPWPMEQGTMASERESRIWPMDLTADEVSRIRANARDNKTTVLGALGASMILATNDLLGPTPDDQIVVTTTLDIRDGLRVPVSVDDLGIYAAVLNSRHSDLKAMSEWDHARDFKAQVTAGIDNFDHYAWVFIGAAFVDQVTDTSGTPMFTDTLANLGAMQLPTEGSSLRPLAIRGALGAHHATFPYVSFNGIGNNGALAMTLTYVHPWVSDERIAEFAGMMTERMRWFAGSGGGS
jgi:hypothetical protein